MICGLLCAVDVEQARHIGTRGLGEQRDGQEEEHAHAHRLLRSDARRLLPTTSETEIHLPLRTPADHANGKLAGQGWGPSLNFQLATNRNESVSVCHLVSQNVGVRLRAACLWHAAVLAAQPGAFRNRPAGIVRASTSRGGGRWYC